MNNCEIFAEDIIIWSWCQGLQTKFRLSHFLV